MSRKPTIKLSYPDASTLAMQLTDAMIRRAPGKRVLETTSEDKAGDGEGSLLDGLNSVRTSTGVEMTLTLEPNSMDYALEQLIRPNLTEEEKKSIFGEESTSADLLSKKEQAAIDSAADELANGLIMANQEKQIEIGKIRDRDLRDILEDLVDCAQGYVSGGPDAYKNHIENAIETAIKEIDHRAGVIDLEETYEQKENALVFKQDIEAIICNALEDHFPNLNTVAAKLTADDLARRLNLHTRIACDPNRGYDRHQIEIALAVLLYAAPDREWDQEDVAEWAAHVYDMLHPLIPGSQPNFIDPESIKNLLDECELIAARRGNVITAQSLAKELSDQDYQKRLERDRQEKEQENTSGEKPKKAKKSRKKKQDPSWDDVEAEARKIGQDKPDDDRIGEIDSGLLNDLDDRSDGMAPAEEVIGHDD